MSNPFEKLEKNLTARGFAVSVFETKEEAADYLCENIRETAVGMGGSVTLDRMGIYERLREKNEVFWHWKDGSPDVRGRAAAAPVYLSSANAISESGDIVNIDGTGNRLAGTVFGNKKLYIVAGANKICPDLESAVSRARNTAGVQNALRLGRKTPCTVDGVCHDCFCPDCICRAMLVTRMPMAGMKTEIVLINEELGY